jgi:Fur family ferric uptake transcriptional regulator
VSAQTQQSAVSDRARARLRATGERVTPARLAVFAVLLEGRRALSHHEIERALGAGRPVDRVTLYRVLEWLVAQGLAHRVAGLDRVWHFGLAERDPRGRHEGHAHFQCHGCGKVVCLAEVTTRRVPVPRGFRSDAVDVKGLCAECA